MNGRRKKNLRISVAVATAALLAAACSSGASSPSSASGGAAPASAKVTIQAVLPPNTGEISSPQNASLAKYTKEYETNHPNVTVNWQPNPTGAIVTANATLVTEASGGDAPDVVWEQYNPLLSGSIPAGILQDLRPWLNKPNPYIKGTATWLASFDKSTVPYMTSPDGSMNILLGSNVETGFFYSKAAFTKAGIAGAPATWADLMQDLAKLKTAGYTPLMYATGGPCNPSWYERLADSQYLHNSLPKWMVDKSPVTTGKDVASGIVNGYISMKNPAYAQVWKMLYDLKPYISNAAGSYDACSVPAAVSPPLSPQPLLVQGKVAMVWGGSWFIPQLNTAGFTGKYGLFPEPPVTSATSSYSAGLSTKGVIGGPNGDGQWSITSAKADKSMTPAKTNTVMDFMAWLFTPQHIGDEVRDWGQGGADIPTVTGAPVPSVPGLASLVPAAAPPTVVDVALDDVLSTTTTNTGLRLVSQLMAGGISFDAFSTQWDQLLQAGAQAYATQNHFALSSLKK
jgi:ABC-type glycerol-3-phosphate transport system substrate-binding protein